MADPQTLLRSRGYVGLLVMAAIIVVARIAPADSEDPDASSSPAPPVRAEAGTAKDKQPEPG